VAIYAAKTGRDAEAIYNEIETPKYYTAQQALELGWVDEIVGTTEDLLSLTNKAEVEVMTETEVEVKAESNTPIFSLSNLLKKCKDLIKGNNELDTMQNRLEDYARQITELE
jgi:ClpP class serine protease